MFINLWLPVMILVAITLFLIYGTLWRNRLKGDNTGKPGSAIGL